MHRTSRLRLEVGALFAIVATAFVAVNVVVLAAVWPQLRRLEHLYGNLATAVDLVAELRGAAQGLRTLSTGVVLRAETGDARAAEGAAAELTAQLDRIERLEAAYGPLVDDEEESRAWSAIRDRELPALVAQAAAAIETARHRGTAPPAALEALSDRSVRVDQLFAELARINAAMLRRGAQDVSDSLHRLLVLCAILLVGGGAAAALLLARSLAVIRRYATVMDARLQELDAFASRVAHDLRNPLQTISLGLASVSRRVEDEAVRATAERAQGGVRRLNGMISDLLEFARSGATPEPGASADVAVVFEELRDELQPAAERAGVCLALDAEPVRAAASATAVRAIVANLVENGIKYTRDDGPRTVTASARRQGREVRIEVRDTGIGIPAARLPSIFDPFVGSRVRRDSYGLGLATVKRLVDAHGGSVTVESEEGAGTAFVVELPRAAEVETI
jgi:signal transduction histidine kinase